MTLWQHRSPVAQCYGCDKIIDYGEGYCWHCWEAWRASPAGQRHFARRVQKSSWTYPEGRSWEDQEWDTWGSTWHGDAAAGQRETAQWQAVPPPASLDSGAPPKRARSQPARARFWQPKASGPSSSSGSQSAEAAQLPVVLETIPEAVPEAAPAAESAAASEQPGNLIRRVFGGSQQAETVDAAMADSSGNQSVEAAEATATVPPQKVNPWEGATVWRGQHYAVKISKDVNTSHSLEEIWDHVGAFPEHACAPKRDVSHEVPFQSIDDYVNTIRQSCRHGGAFRWPSNRYGFMRAISVAFHHLPVGHMFSIKNAQEIPDDYYHKSGKLD